LQHAARSEKLALMKLGAAWRSGFWLFGFWLLGCGSAVRDAASFSGTRASRRVQANEVRYRVSLPPAFERIGRVTSRCALIQDAAAFDGAWLSDIDCSRVRVERALRAAAAEAGGELLVGRRCRWAPPAGETRALLCEADVARNRGGSPGTSFSDDEMAAELRRVWALDDPTGTAAWRMRVSLTILGPLGARSPRRADLVSENATLPLARRELAAVRVTCEHSCSRDATRASVRVVAGRLGASDVAGVACIESGQGWECSGTIADYEAEPSASERL
jgi:hypothetical protein